MKQSLMEAVTETHRLVLTEDLNQYGHLFGGRLLSWVDEAAFITVSSTFPNCKFLTIAMNRVEFLHMVQNGSILKFVSKVKKIGKTSVTCSVEIFNKDLRIFLTDVTFVNVNDKGEKTSVLS